jgi:hypothetical protein
MTMKTDTASNDPRDYDPLYWINIALKELQAKGLVCDSGERRNGQIVWKITPAGKKFARRQDKADAGQ